MAVLLFLLIVVGLRTILYCVDDNFFRYKSNETLGISHTQFVINKTLVTISIRNDAATGAEHYVVTSDPVAITKFRSCLLKLEKNNNYARTDAQICPVFYTITFSYADGSSEIREFRMYQVSKYTDVFRDFYDYLLGNNE